MLYGLVAVLAFPAELLLLQARIRCHAALLVSPRQLEHGQIQRVDARQGDELEFVAHGPRLLLEALDGGIIQVLLPIERRRAVVRQHLAGMSSQDRFREAPRLFEIRLGGLAPNQVGVGRIGNAARDRGIQSAANAEEAFRRSFAGDKFGIARIDVAGQKMGAIGVGAGHNQGWHTHDVGRKTRRHQFLDSFAGGHQDFASHVAAFLGRGELVLKVDARHTRFDHRLHQLEGI
jgi:hypothetical protein